MVRSLLIHVFVLGTFILLRTLSPLQTFSSLVTPSSWFYDLLSSACVAGHCILTVRHLRPTPLVASGPLFGLKAALTAEAGASLAAHALLAAALVRCYLGLDGGSLNGLAVKCFDGT